jgi:hypothetical protein
MALRIASKSAALLWIIGSLATTAVAAIMQSNRHRERRSPRDSTILVCMPGRCWWLREKSHDLSGDDGYGPVERPHSTQSVEVSDTRGFNAVLPVLFGASPQKAVAADPLDYGNG